MTNIHTSDTPTQPRCIELSWDDVVDGNFPETRRDRWVAAVDRAAALVAGNPVVPAEAIAGRIRKAMDLAKIAGGVTQHEDGVIVVRSGKKVYEITDQCTCEYVAKTGEMYCSHYLAWLLHREALVILDEPAADLEPEPFDEDDDVDATPEPATAAWTLSDPPFVHTLKWVDALGIEHMHVIRAFEFDTVAVEVRRMTQLIKAAQSAHQVATPAATNGTVNGTHEGEPRIAVVMCPKHGTAKLKPSKYGGTYCAAKDGEA